MVVYRGNKRCKFYIMVALEIVCNIIIQVHPLKLSKKLKYILKRCVSVVTCYCEEALAKKAAFLKPIFLAKKKFFLLNYLAVTYGASPTFCVTCFYNGTNLEVTFLLFFTHFLYGVFLSVTLFSSHIFRHSFFVTFSNNFYINMCDDYTKEG